MDHDFWHRAWNERRLGFHLPAVNPLLAAHWASLGLTSGDAVLVPLCGKTVDLWWLAQRGHPVVGVELSPIACQELFSEAGVQPDVVPATPYVRWRHGPIDVLQGDVFDLPSALPVAGFYDRAATVALPPELRERYARTLAAALPSGSAGLLVTFDVPARGEAGPPFSVPDAEVRRLYGDGFVLEKLAREADPTLAGNLSVDAAWQEVWRAVRR